ncbi:MULTISPECIES: hypothetical protein [Aeromonas]|uniref:hypothetical protein n=1 Tax=Aeromonas TaxID=642 RepID=UPI002B05D6D9|nr:hypothetical protein [Aeromonas jandaei]
MNGIEFLERYLDKMDQPLAVEQERYGGGYRVILLHRTSAEFLFDMLEGDDNEGTQAQFFLGENMLFPSAWGRSLGQALRRLSAKLEAMYEITDKPGRSGVARKFKLLAEYDTEPGEDKSYYDVEFEQVVDDCRHGDWYWFEDAKEKCSQTENRNLHAWVNFQWPADLKEAVTKAEKLE